MRRVTAIGRAAALVLSFIAGVLAAGCGEDRPECTASDLGVLRFEVSPQLLDGVRTFTGTLNSVQEFITDPPIVRYQFTPTAGGTVTIDLRDIGYRIPVTEGQTYTVQVQNFSLPGTVLRGYGLTVSDGDGLVALLVTDYEPYPGEDSLVFADGYPLTGLQVLFEDGGCDPRVENTIDYLDVVNRRLGFLVGDDTVRLYQRETGTVGDWTARVFRAERIRPKNPLKIDTQISFAIERSPGPVR